MERVTQTMAPSNRRPAPQPLPHALSPSHALPRSACPCLPTLGVLLLNQDPRAYLEPLEPLTLCPPPCTKSDPPLFHLRKLP